MVSYTFYETKRKLTCEYVDKYNKLYIYEDKEALECLSRVSKYKYNKATKEDDIVTFRKKSLEVTFEDYEYLFKKYKLNKFSSLLLKQTIIDKVSHLVRPSKIFIIYIPTILLGAKLLNLPEEPRLYGEGIDIIKELAEPIDTNEEDMEQSLKTEPVEEEEISSNINSNISAINTYDIDIECYDKGESEDTKYVMEKYGDIIEELANRYGFSPNLIIGMVTQESHGVHENLMQVTFNLNADYISKRYNFETNKYETIVLTNSPEEYPDVDIVITEEMMKEPYYAILAGIDALRIDYDEYSLNNPISALEMYNKGYGNWMKVLKETSRNTGASIENILYNPSDMSYLSYTDILKVGDKDYTRNVMQYVPNAFEDGIYVKAVDSEGNIEMIRLRVNKTLGKVKNK